MRFSEVAVDLGEEETALAINLLTVASGRLARSVHLLSDDAPTGRVLDSLARGSAALLRARHLLNDQPPTADADDHDRALVPDGETATMPWRTFLATLPEADGERLHAWLTEAVRQTRSAGILILEDGAIAAIRLHLVGAVAALADATRVIAGRADRS